MRSLLDRLDEGLYALAGRALRPRQRRALLGAVTAALFAFLCTRSFPQLEPGVGPLALTAALFALAGLLFMLPAFGRIAREEGDLGVYLLCAAACGALLLARLSMLERRRATTRSFCCRGTSRCSRSPSRRRCGKRSAITRCPTGTSSG